MTSRRAIQAVAGASLAYDLAAGVLLLTATGSVASWFGAPLPVPVLFVKLDALFLIAVGLGYLHPLRQPDGGRWYMWIFGAGLKAAGAAAFLIDHAVNGSPSSFLLFAASDGALAGASVVALLLRRA